LPFPFLVFSSAGAIAVTKASVTGGKVQFVLLPRDLVKPTFEIVEV